MKLGYGDWRVTYCKQNNVWSLHLYCHDMSMLNNKAGVQVCVLISNYQEKVIQLQRETAIVVTCGARFTIHMANDETEQDKHIALLIKPVPC